MSNQGRSTTGGPAVPYYPESSHREAVKHLRLMCTRYLADREPFDSIEKAMAWLTAETAKLRNTGATRGGK